MASKESYESSYRDLVGFVPPKTTHRIRIGLESDPELLDMVEQLRGRALNPDTMDEKTAQMMTVGILLALMSPAAEYHIRACQRLGASKKELHDVTALAFMFRGLPAFNLGAELINKVFDELDSPAPASGR